MGEGPGEVLAGRYRILGTLGRGGMGVVWRAWDAGLEQEVALKELRLPEQIGEDERHVLYARMEREARAAARLTHPGVVRVHERVAGEDGRPWIVMELIRGGSLADLLRGRGRLPVKEVAAIGLQMVDALSAAHDQGIVHRDVKPANVLLEGERAVLTDFGIAALEGDATLTNTGTILGTPAFMAPEQVRGRPATPRSDLWSLGATLFAAVEGGPPFTGPNHGSIYLAIATEQHAPFVHAGPLGEVLAGLLRKDPGARLTAGAVRGMLEAIVAPLDLTLPETRPPLPKPPRARSALVAVTAALVVGAGAVAGVWALQPSGGERPGAAPTSAAPRPTVIEGSDEIWGLAFSPDGKTLARVGEDGALELWDVATGKKTATLAQSSKSKHEVEFSPDGKTIAADDGDNGIGLWDVASGRAIATFDDPDGAGAWSLAFGPDGRTLAIGVSTFLGEENAKNMIRLWDVSGHGLTATLSGLKQVPGTVAFSPDGRTLACDDDKDVRLWDVGTRRSTALLKGQDKSLFSVAFSPDGKTLAAGGKNETRLWDVADRRPRKKIATGAHQVAFSPDGRFLASRMETDGAVRLWDAGTGEAAGSFTGNAGGVSAMAFSPAGGLLASGDFQGTVRFWKLP
ncbi:WD40 repeat domain-containing serine/threonine protein kinase [Spirillospora sp. CA-128828]|uniref:WD40 repeat domain-containing serine/threonine protein kinase n=1 Tax=Spirillospora sp. CA-128828 TaxID=3240033 RepID=UPI003D8D6426